MMMVIILIRMEVLMPKFLFVSEAARRLCCRPREISDLFYQRRVNDHAALLSVDAG